MFSLPTWWEKESFHSQQHRNNVKVSFKDQTCGNIFWPNRENGTLFVKHQLSLGLEFLGMISISVTLRFGICFLNLWLSEWYIIELNLWRAFSQAWSRCQLKFLLSVILWRLIFGIIASRAIYLKFEACTWACYYIDDIWWLSSMIFGLDAPKGLPKMHGHDTETKIFSIMIWTWLLFLKGFMLYRLILAFGHLVLLNFWNSSI